MKKIFLFAFLLSLIGVPTTHAATGYVVHSGDTLWKIAVKHQVGLKELLQANPQIKNPALIYPGQQINIPDSVLSDKAVEVAKLVNAERAKRGLSPLKLDWELSRVALHKAMDMKQRNYFSHDSPTYGSPFDMMTNYGIRYRSAGENIAYGYPTSREVMDGWMTSRGHRSNILSPDYDTIGVGYYQGYWVQMFIGR